MKNYLSVKNLSYSYPDGHLALKKISFDLAEKESLAILGPNGAGKTTLILHLNGILGTLNSEISVDQLDYIEDNIGKIRKTVGIVFQDPDDQLFMPTVIEDVMFGPKNFGFTDEESERLALDALDKDRDFLNAGDVFTNNMIDSYIDLKMDEVQRLRQSTHPCEFEMYYSL